MTASLPPRPIAHTRNQQGVRQDLVDHLERVAAIAADFALCFGADRLAWLAGVLHDIGKFNPAFQQYLLDAEAHPSAHSRGPDHKGAGAWLALQLHADPLAFLVAGHHGGLHALSDLKVRLRDYGADPAVQAAVSAAQATLNGIQTPLPVAYPAFVQTESEREFFIRMLFSTLVDADFLDTEGHFNPGTATQRSAYPSLATFEQQFLADQQRRFSDAPTDTTHMTPAHRRLNTLRNDVFQACLDAASLAPGFFRLTVPTGGGKTRSSLAFALRHATAHGLRRIIYALPFITITEQTTAVFRGIFGDHAILEHHSGVTPADPDSPTPQEVISRLAAENWDAPLIVTTTVQLFESLMARGTSRCRKLHNIAGSVIILDEAQALPTTLLTPILDALRQLVTHYRVTVLLCTATQPALDSDNAGFPAIEGIRDIVPNSERLFSALQRVEYHWPEVGARLAWDEVAALIRGEAQALAIVNTRKDALALLSALTDLNADDDISAFYLSTWLCGAHRRRILELVRQRLAAGQPCRLVSTQLIEAGVDIDFPLVLRALGPLDSIVQAAGRCNRNGLLPTLGRVIIFDPAEGGLPPGPYRTATDVTRGLPADLDLHDPTIYRLYFERFYRRTDHDARQIQRLRHALDYPEVARQFRMIDDDTHPVVIADYREAGGETPAAIPLAALRHNPAQARRWLRVLQPYIVNLRQSELIGALKRGAAEELAELPSLYVWRGRYDAVQGLDPGGYPDPGQYIV